MSGLPQGWVPTTLGEVAEFEMGQAPPGTDSNADGKGAVFVKAGEFGRLKPTIREWTTNPKKFAKEGDVLICVVGATAGKLNLGIDCAIGRSVAAIRPSNAALQKTIYFQLLPQVMRLRAGTTGSAQGVISKDALAEIPFYLPPLPEQKRIADKLDTVLARVDACRDRLDRLPTMLKRFRQSILAAATSGRLTEDWRLIHSQNNWGEEPLGKLIADGPQNGLYKHSSAYGAGTGILRIDMFYDGEVTGWNGMKLLDVTPSELETYGLSVGDIVVNRVNSPPYVGKAALIRELPQPCVFESNMMRIQLDATRILPEYCIRFLSSVQGLAQLRLNVKHAVNQASINQTDVKSVSVPLPSIAEQHEIVRRVEILFAFADRLEARLATARRQVEQLTPALLAKAFRGELVPQDPANEPASELLKRLAAQRVETPKLKRSRKASE